MKIRALLVLSFAALLPVTTLSAQSSGDSLRDRAAGFLGGAVEDGQIPSEVATAVKSLAESFDLSQLRLSGFTGDALQALRKGEDADALGYLERVGEAASLSAGQQSLYENVKVLVDAFVLERNFSDVPEMSGAVGKAVTAIRSGDYRQATAALNALGTEARPTEAQSDILESLREQYEEWGQSRPSEREATASAS